MKHVIEFDEMQVIKSWCVGTCAYRVHWNRNDAILHCVGQPEQDVKLPKIVKSFVENEQQKRQHRFKLISIQAIPRTMGNSLNTAKHCILLQIDQYHSSIRNFNDINVIQCALHLQLSNVLRLILKLIEFSSLENRNPIFSIWFNTNSRIRYLHIVLFYNRIFKI